MHKSRTPRPRTRRAPTEENAAESPRRRGRGRADRDENHRSNRHGRFDKRGSREAEAEDEAPTARFSGLLMRKARATYPDLVAASPRHPEPLARLDYARELDLKNQVLQEFWQANGLPDKPNRIHPSPKPRRYRITTKRRVVLTGRRFHLDFLPEQPVGSERLGPGSELEPAEHKTIYAFLLEKLNGEAYGSLAHALNYIVIRGDYRRFAVFFNVHRLNAAVVRKGKMLAEHLRTLEFPKSADGVTSKVLSAFIFFDPSKSPFYLDSKVPEGPWKLKKLFGPDHLRLQVGDREYVFQPTAFCQVNGSILPDFLEKAESLLKPKSHQRLLDLYCGFGFFGLKLAPAYAEALGVDAASASMESAREMASEQKVRIRFRQGKITARALETLLPAKDDKPEALLLDPPRYGVEPGVIRALAARAPVRVLHIFCDLDVLPREVNQWRKSGYMVSKVVPVDMFPGTDNLEVLVLFIPDRYGILNRVADAPAPGDLYQS